MPQALAAWNDLTLRNKVFAVMAALALVATLAVLGQKAAQPRLALLYAQLDQAAAGEVVHALEARNVQYDVRGGAIFVDAAQRDALRLTLASEGLPSNGPKGYELLDGLTGFGTTAQMFDAAYWRAKEGELARTILSAPGVVAARVHIAQSAVGTFQRDGTVSASVFLTTASGTIEPGMARGLRFLVASAVPRLDPSDVSIIDSTGRLVGVEDEGSGPASAEDRATQLRDRVERLVAARVGPGNVVVEVSVVTETDTESIRERRFDPEGRVAISTDTEERTLQSEDSAAGVTVASNLPDGDAAAGAGSTSENNQTRERINYEVSETTREILRSPGAVRRLTVAVLVNGTTGTDADGTPVFTPRPDAELEVLRELVASAVGYEESRGDRITIRSLAFEQTAVAGTAAPVVPWYLRAFDPMALVQVGVLAVVALLLGLFVLRPLLSPQSAGAGPLALTAEPEPEDTTVPSGNDAFALNPPEATTDDLPMLMADGAGFGEELGLASAIDDDPIERLRGMIDSRKDETVEVLRNWLDEKENA